MRVFAVVCALFVVGCGGSTLAGSAPGAGAHDGGGTDAGSQPVPLEAGADDGPAGPDPCFSCADQGLLCDPSGGCVACLTNQDCAYQHGSGNPNAVCLPDHTCGCTADPQCAGLPQGTRCVASQCGCNGPADCIAPGALACAPNHRCGCGSNADCVTDGGVGSGLLPTPVCKTDTGTCVGCVTDADCTDPNNRVCDPTTNICLPCRTSVDCAKNADGPVCGDLGQYTLGIGSCGCAADSDCPGHTGGPRCVANGSPYDKCGCVTAADCAADPQGYACVNPYNDGWLQCGCATTSDCPSGRTCSSYLCQ
jgi:hypothetical protein